MEEENNEVKAQESYPGADLDVIEVPDDVSKILIGDTAEGEKKEESGAEKESGEQDAGAKAEEAPEEKKRRKHSDFQKRLDELTREKHEAREAKAAAEAKAELLEQQLREIKAAKTASTEATDLEKRERELIEKRRQAEEDGDLARYSEASDELIEVRIKRHAVEFAPAAKAEEVQQTKVADRGSEQLVPEAKQWLENNPWFSERGNEHLADEVISIQERLISEYGYDLRKPADAKKVYEEISKEIRRRPEFDKFTREYSDATETDTRSQQRSHIAPPSRGGEAPERPVTGQLTQYDIRAMKMVGIDPADPKARAAYLKRKRA